MATPQKWKNPTKTPEYYAWRSMRSRCINPMNASYPQYGARGISVCQRWINDYDAFFDDMGTRPSPKHSIDRIDVNGHYSPENCRWATAKEQALNRTTTELLEHNGQRLTVTEWADALGIPRDRLWRRLYVQKQPLDVALTAGLLRPVLKHGTRSGYSYFRCRCELCKAANAAESRKFRQKRKEQST